MSEAKQKPLFGKKTEEKETVVQEPKVTETPMVTMSIEELETLIEKKVNAAKSPAPEVKQERVISKEEKTIRNVLTDDIPELIDFKAKERMYVLCDGSKPEARELKTRHKPGSPLQYWNRITNQTYSLFFSLTQTSFFKELHQGDSKVDHVFFKDGMLNVYEDQVKLQKFLHIHPDNRRNGGSLFEEYNAEIEAQGDLEDIDLKFEAEKMARDISFIRQDAVARLLCKEYKETWTPAELKRALYLEAGKQPREFIRLANDVKLEVKGVAKTACHRGFIEYRGYKFINDMGETIVEVPRGSDEWEVLADHFLSGAGRVYYDYLRNAIN